MHRATVSAHHDIFGLDVTMSDLILFKKRG
ncbi:hypothetical protein EMIT0P2_10196 [Pseudomonas sp. IT-P2]